MGKAEKTVLAEVVREHQRIRLNRRLCLTGASLVAQMVVSVTWTDKAKSLPDQMMANYDLQAKSSHELKIVLHF